MRIKNEKTQEDRVVLVPVTEYTDSLYGHIVRS